MTDNQLTGYSLKEISKHFIYVNLWFWLIVQLGLALISNPIMDLKNRTTPMWVRIDDWRHLVWDVTSKASVLSSHQLYHNSHKCLARHHLNKFWNNRVSLLMNQGWFRHYGLARWRCIKPSIIHYWISIILVINQQLCGRLHTVLTLIMNS